jgi:hypothetical protein
MKGQVLGVAAAISAEGDAEGESPEAVKRERSSGTSRDTNHLCEQQGDLS